MANRHFCWCTFVASVGSWSIMFEEHVRLQFCFEHGETVRKLNALELCLQPFNSGDPCKKRNTLRSEKPQFFFVALYRKEGYVASWKRQTSLQTKENHLLNPVVKEGMCWWDRWCHKVCVSWCFFQWKKVNLPAEKYTCWKKNHQLSQKDLSNSTEILVG